MVRARAIAAAAISVLCVACAEVEPDYKVPPQALVNAPPAQGAFISGSTVASDESLPDHWWWLYDDPVLDRLIENALANNGDLKAAEANLERSDALLALAHTAREPSAAIGASTNYTQQSAQAVLSHVQPPRHEIYDMGVSISYDLDLFGGIRRGIEASAADRDAVVAARDLVRVNVAAQTAHAYSDLCNAGNQIDIVQQQIAAQQRRLALTRELIANGRAPAFSQDQQRGEIESSRAQLAPLEASRMNAAFRPATPMGQPPANYDKTLLACHAPLQLKTPLPAGDGRTLLSRRPDVRTAERHLAAATADIGVETAALYPDIKIGASIGSTGAASSFLSPLTNCFAVGPMVSWDLHRSAIRDRIAAELAQSRVSLAHFDRTVLSALRETETSLDNYASALDRLQRLESARDEAREVDARTDELWRGGKFGGLAALDAQRTRLAAESAVATAQADVNNDRIATFLALGGGWQ
ncbi:efflux transporter outer membrane subunit [Paraburkholderia sacchari]|uniref:efflux transporter outer membrane subunit n=1 Tax=Paraburkholderia sacchari TaxID=159450 RepID=UPI001BCC1423|nr:efflux transporter outer membrane subunit [Paraburkholderia sacchari]